MERIPPGPHPAISHRSAFAAGIISPMLRFRFDMEKWQTGACQLTNFCVHEQTVSRVANFAIYFATDR